MLHNYKFYILFALGIYVFCVDPKTVTIFLCGVSVSFLYPRWSVFTVRYEPNL